MMDDREYWIRFPFPPSLNGILGLRHPDEYWGIIKERAAQVAFSIADGRPITGGVGVRYFYKKHDLMRVDIENLSKAVADGFTIGGLWIDDYQIDDSHAFRMPIHPGAGYVDIHIRVISEVAQYDKCYAMWYGVKRDGHEKGWTIERPKKKTRKRVVRKKK